MKHRGLLAIVILGIAAAGFVAGCGGGGGGKSPSPIGIYKGPVKGCHHGTIKFYVGPDLQLVGFLRIDGCGHDIRITGKLVAQGTGQFGVTWQGTGCDVSYVGTGTLKLVSPGGSVYSGGGPYTATDSDGHKCHGTWGVTFRGRTGGEG